MQKGARGGWQNSNNLRGSGEGLQGLFLSQFSGLQKEHMDREEDKGYFQQLGRGSCVFLVTAEPVGWLLCRV